MAEQSSVSETRSEIDAGRKRSGLTRREFVQKSAAVGVLGTVASGIGWRGAIAQEKKLVVTTMPGPRWEGALKASAKAYMAKHPDVADRDSRLALCRALSAHRHEPDRRLRATSTCICSIRC